MDLNQITLPTADLTRSVAFYTTLGLIQIVDSPHYARFEVPDGDATFSLHVADTVTPSGAVIYFECVDLDDRVKALESAGIEFDEPPTDQRWLWREARLRDPDGHRAVAEQLHWRTPPEFSTQESGGAIRATDYRCR